MLRGRCHAGGYSQAGRPEPSAWNLRPDPAAFHAPAYPLQKRRDPLYKRSLWRWPATLLNITQVPIGDTEVFRGIPEI